MNLSQVQLPATQNEKSKPHAIALTLVEPRFTLIFSVITVNRSTTNKNFCIKKIFINILQITTFSSWVSALKKSPHVDGSDRNSNYKLKGMKSG